LDHPRRHFQIGIDRQVGGCGNRPAVLDDGIALTVTLPSMLARPRLVVASPQTHRGEQLCGAGVQGFG